MELLQLRYFYESAKAGSFARTAEKFNVPATSVSASVKRLEKELGCQLFDRSCNRILLNGNGKRLQRSLVVIFDELEQTAKALSSVDADNREIKMLVRTARTALTDAIIAYKAKHPLVTFKIVFDFAETDFEKYDIVIDEESDRYPEHEYFPLYSTHIRIRAASDNPLCRAKLTLKQLKDQPFISTGEQNSMHHILIEACKRSGFTPNVVITCNDVKCYERYLAAGVGIGVSREFPNTVLPEDSKYLNITDFYPSQILCCYYKRNAAYGNVKDFIDYLLATAQ